MIESFDTNSLTSCSHALLAALVDGLEIRLWEEDVLQEIFPSPVDDQCRAGQQQQKSPFKRLDHK